jgi:hypothetical protein
MTDAARPYPYMLIKDEEIIGRFDRYADALNAGYTRFGLQPFRVQLGEKPPMFLP